VTALFVLSQEQALQICFWIALQAHLAFREAPFEAELDRQWSGRQVPKRIGVGKMAGRLTWLAEQKMRA